MSSRQPDPTPFQLTCTPAVPELLTKLNCTIALSTYQAGKLVFVSPKNAESLVQLPRTFHRPMALQYKDGSLTVSTASTVEVFVNDARMAPNYPGQPGTYDALYLPRQTFQTGRVDTHGLEWGPRGGLWMVNTRFSCLARLTNQFSFEPWWFPPFITDMAPEDRCHLNGVASREGAPVFVTALSQSNEKEGWRKTLPDNGILIDVDSNEIVAEGLFMPHSPRFVEDRLYALMSATGELTRIDVKTGRCDVVQKIGGFVRGMAYHRSHLFIAHSKLRKNSSTFRDLPIADEATEAGVAIVHEPTGAMVGRLTYLQSVDEIFDVAILPDQIRPGIVGLDREERSLAVTTPRKTYWIRQEKPDTETGSAPAPDQE